MNCHPQLPGYNESVLKCQEFAIFFTQVVANVFLVAETDYQ